MAACKLKKKPFYDMALLSVAKLPIDGLMERAKDARKVTMFRKESSIWKGLYDIDPDTVTAFADEARAYLKRVRAEKSAYGYLYFVAEHSADWHTVPHFDYLQFPLMQSRACTLNRVKELAQEFEPKKTSLEFDATCLYLLYFFALRVNPSLNWIMVDYLANGNRYHQFGTRLKGRMKVVTKKTWV